MSGGERRGGTSVPVSGRHFSVALIGPDGAGKTTLTRKLEGSGLLPFRYVYMGINADASTLTLPTFRLAARLRRRAGRGSEAAGLPPAQRPRQRGLRSRVRSVARLVNRFAEEWYRQLVSWYLQLRGFVVLYDRHFVFDYAPEIAAGPADGLGRRLHRWWLAQFYPRPDLVIFLDAPGAVLYARKGESTVEELERRRQGFLRQGERVRNFVRVDATRPLDQVYAEVAEQILRFHRNGHPESKP